MLPEISVLLPCRNAEATVAEAIDSLLAHQTVRLELLVVDDGSTDASAAIAQSFGPQVRLLRTSPQRRGLVAALELARAAARAPFIARMDADDVALPTRLARQLDALQSTPGVAAIGTQVEAFPADAIAGGMLRYVAWQNSLITPADHHRELFIEAPLCHPSVLLRADALQQVGGWRDLPVPEDYDLWLRLDAAGWQLAKVPEVLLRWRHQPGRATFSDPRCGRQRFVDAKAPHLARRLRTFGRPVAVWGAGRTGKRLARAMEPYGVVADHFIDFDRNKLGRTARGRPIVHREQLTHGTHTIVAAVGAFGARQEIRGHLQTAGFVEGTDYLCAA